MKNQFKPCNDRRKHGKIYLEDIANKNNCSIDEAAKIMQQMGAELPNQATIDHLKSFENNDLYMYQGLAGLSDKLFSRIKESKKIHTTPRNQIIDIGEIPSVKEEQNLNTKLK